MSSSVQLDAQPLSCTIKVDDIGTVAMLTTKLPAIKLAVLQIKPKEFLCGSRIVS
jgi:hypothetical protein